MYSMLNLSRAPRASRGARTGEGEVRDVPRRNDGVFVMGDSIKSLSDEEFRNKFGGTVIKALAEKGIVKLSQLQKVLGANIDSGSDGIIVHREHATATEDLQRTLSFMIPIMHEIAEPPGYIKVDSISPRVLIVTGSLHRGSVLKDQLHQFLTRCNPRARVEFKTIKFFEWSLLDVLITDIKSFNSSRNTTKSKCIALERLSFIIFDDCQSYFMKYEETLRDTVNIAAERAKFFEDCKTMQRKQQIFFSSTRWDSDFASLYSEVMYEPILFMDSYSELLNFAKIKWAVDITNENNEMEILREIATSKMTGPNNIAISCSTREKAELIGDVMVSFVKKITIIARDGEYTKCGAPIIRDSTTREVFIFIDDMGNLREVRRRLSLGLAPNCTHFLSFDGKGQLLKEYDPSTQALGLPFLWNCLPKNFNESHSTSRKNLTVNYMLRAGAERSLITTFYALSKRLQNAELSLAFEQVAIEIWEKRLKVTPLCQGFTLFGFCNKEKGYVCYKRHEFNETDIEGNIFGAGEIEFSVAQYHPTNVNVYKGELRAHYVEKDNSLIELHSFKGYSASLKKNSSNKIGSRKIEIGEMYGLCVNDEYFRVKIESFVVSSVAGRVNIQYVDIFKMDTIASMHLFDLSMEDKQLPRLAVYIYLLDLRPLRGELEFVANDNECCESSLDMNQIYRGKVILALNGSIWINPMVKKSDPSWSLRSFLIDKKLAELNPQHEVKLIESAIKLGESYKAYRYLHKEHQKHSFGSVVREFYNFGDRYNWAYLRKDQDISSAPHQLQITEVASPVLVYGIQSKFSGLLNELEKDIERWTSKIVDLRTEAAKEDFWKTVVHNLVVAVKDRSTQRWKRGLCLRNDTTGSTLNVFLVDSGKLQRDVGMDEVLPLQDKLVSRFPFQAVGLCLKHIKAVEGSYWTEEEIESMKEYILKDTDMNSPINSVYVTALKGLWGNSQGTPCKNYEALIMVHDEEIGYELIKKGKATPAKEYQVDCVEKMRNQIQRMVTIDEGFDNEFDVVLNDSKKPFGLELNNLKLESPQREEVGSRINDTKIPSETECSFNKDNVDVNNTTLRSDSTKAGVEKLDNIRHPTVFWCQTYEEVIFRIQIPDLKEFILDIDKKSRRGITFKSVDPPGYVFNMSLFGKVELEYKIFSTGQEMKITFSKVNKELWIRINQAKDEKLRWLKQDFNTMEEPFEDNENEDMIANLEPVQFDNYDDLEGSDSDDEDHTFFQANEKFRTPEDNSLDPEVFLPIED